MIKQAIGTLILGLGAVGCATGLPESGATDYADLPGVRDTPKGPGLLSANHYDPANGGGTLLFSTEADKPAVFNSGLAGAAAESDSAASPVAAASPGRPTTGPAQGTSAGATETDARAYHRFRAFQRFEAFRAYRRFQTLPDDAPQRQRFRRWLQWRRHR